MTHSTMEQADIVWRSLGLVRLKSSLEHVPEQSGLYKLTFKLWGNTYAYIGQAGPSGLRRRIGEYANNPTEGNKGEHLMHDLLKEAGKAELSISCSGLDNQKARLHAEKRAITNAKQQGMTCINKGGCTDDIRMQRFILKSAERMLERDLARVRSKLATLDPA